MDSRVEDERHRRVRQEHDVVTQTVEPSMVPLGPGNNQYDDERRGEDDVGEEDEKGVLEARLVVV